MQINHAKRIALKPSLAHTQQTVFLGESSPLTCVIDEGRSRSPKGYANEMSKTRLHYSIPERLDANTTRDEALRAHKSAMEDQLTRNGAFAFPSKDIREPLLQAYFTWFHPCFPILDRKVIHDTYKNESISPLLLQSMLFIGVSLCPDTTFAKAGFQTRYRAKVLFHSRARAIYDADWESNKITKLQALFLLSFWRGGPNEERDTRFWLEVGICLAQKRGMHVMSKLSFQSGREEMLWKRIWWAYYIRDQQSSAALGLPSRIRDEDCDVAMLEPKDIKDEESVDDQAVFGVQRAEHIPYPIEMAKLARLLRAIVSTQYVPREPTANGISRETLHAQLTEWESHLPAEMKLESHSTPSAIFLTGLLHMTYNNLYILLYRPLFLHPTTTTETQGAIALEAATRSTRIIEGMLSHNLVQHGPNHLITHAFSTLCIHTINCCRTTGTTRKLAEHRARLCLLGLQELQKSWDLENWVLDLFFRCLDESTAHSLRSVDVDTPAPEGRGERRDQGVGDFSGGAERNDTTSAIAADNSQPSQYTSPTDLTAPNDWYGLFNFTDDYTDVLGTSSQPDSLNLQSLEFLYRFL